MKSEDEIRTMRLHLIAAQKAFAERYGFTFAGEQQSALGVHLMGLGALGVLNAILERDNVDNHGNLVESMRHNVQGSPPPADWSQPPTPPPNYPPRQSRAERKF